VKNPDGAQYSGKLPINKCLTAPPLRVLHHPVTKDAARRQVCPLPERNQSNQATLTFTYWGGQICT
jgi:hypothetical protein